MSGPQTIGTRYAPQRSPYARRRPVRWLVQAEGLKLIRLAGANPRLPTGASELFSETSALRHRI
ncbi:hypothetical protein MESS4_240060 [Mesorhizobium sp. STM 4661]|nr:hypothetical protein MESS4_240060 [Mesorhizobium sp. STM 4661]